MSMMAALHQTTDIAMRTWDVGSRCQGVLSEMTRKARTVDAEAQTLGISTVRFRGAP